MRLEEITQATDYIYQHTEDYVEQGQMALEDIKATEYSRKGMQGEFEGIVPFERIRRITGYLVGTVDRWNDGKKAELRDRTKHMEQLAAME